MAVPSLDIVEPAPVPELPVGSGDSDRPGSPGRHGRHGRHGRWWIEWSLVLVVALLLAVGVRTYVAQMFYIPSGSMLPTLQIGDRIVVDELSYHLHGVQRGDIVVFRRPPLEQEDYSDLVKRVIGLPGDTVSSVDGRVYIDGKPLDEPWLPQPPPTTSPSPVSEGFSLQRPYTVPAGEYYVMGDNRTDSEDSRYFGPIPGKNTLTSVPAPWSVRGPRTPHQVGSGAGGPRTAETRRAADRLGPHTASANSATTNTARTDSATNQTVLLTGQITKAILPTIRFPGIGPKYRLSSESVRLSPIT